MFRRPDPSCRPAAIAVRPPNQPLIRRLMVLKLWQARDTFDPGRLMTRFADSRSFDWDDLKRLVRRTQTINPGKIMVNCISGLAFLADMTPDEQLMAGDPYQRERALWDRLRRDLPAGG